MSFYLNSDFYKFLKDLHHSVYKNYSLGRDGIGMDRERKGERRKEEEEGWKASKENGEGEREEERKEEEFDVEGTLKKSRRQPKHLLVHRNHDS